MDGSPITENGAIIYIIENEISMDVPLTLTNLISFFDGMHHRYNNGNGTQDIVPFVGADFVDDMQIKFKVKLLNNNIFLWIQKHLTSLRIWIYCQFLKHLKNTIESLRIMSHHS